MKSLQNTLLISALMLISTMTFSQKKVTETTLKVDGVCGMCKVRIENALDTAGVKFAEWNMETKLLKVAFRNDKYTVEDISQLLANVGHDTEKVKATEEAYNGVNACCKYRDAAVVESHKGQK